MRTLEARFMVTLAFHSYLFDRIHGFSASSAFVLRSREHTSKSTRCPIQLRGWLISQWLCRWLKVLAETTRLLEKLLKMRPTIHHSFHWWIIAQLKSAFAVRAFEASLVIRDSISWEKLHRVHCLLARPAFLLSSCKRHRFWDLLSTSKDLSAQTFFLSSSIWSNEISKKETQNWEERNAGWNWSWE